uniref:Pentacotripeptide-repeat region of PRORP domain-containing protein n=1 Tax=Leersia perrieri TaxID=77586 RepID=A0A0D9VN09_9ORYZ
MPPIATAALHLLLSRPSLTAAQLRQVHAQLIISSLLSDPFFPNSLLRSLLPASPHRALRLFPRLRRIIHTNPFFPNSYTFSFLLTASASASLHPPTPPPPHVSTLVSSLHALAVVLALDAHAYVSNGLIHAYSSCALLSSARRVFHLNASCRDVCSWTSLLTAYARAARLHDARHLFDEMPDKTTVAYGAMLSAYVGAGSFADAVDVFRDMLRARVRPNRAAVLGVLAACGALGALEQGRWVHAMVSGPSAGAMASDGMVATALIDMYGKCGSLETARQVFDGMPARDVFAYTAMITALSDHGRCAEAIELFGRMQEDGVRPNEVTLICVLSACGRAGMVERAREIFGSMAAAYGMEPGVEHFGSMVDALGRAGMVEEALELVRNMPMRPDSYVMGALLNACVALGGEEVAARVAELGILERSSGAQVQLSNLYAGRGKWEEVVSVRRGMEERELVKVPGCSMVEVDGVAWEFLAGDRSHESWIMDVAAHLHKHLRSTIQ